MLMRNPEIQVANVQAFKRHVGEPLVVYTPREMMLGQLVVILLLVLAILMRAMI